MPNESLKDVLSQITIKHVMQTERRIRRWDEGRRYDLLRCYHTLIQEHGDVENGNIWRYQMEPNDKSEEGSWSGKEDYEVISTQLADTFAISDDIIDQFSSPVIPAVIYPKDSLMQPNSLYSLGQVCYQSKQTKVKLDQIETFASELFEWFRKVRGATVRELTPALLLNYAIVMSRNAQINHIGKKIFDDRLTLSRLIELLKTRTKFSPYRVALEEHRVLSGAGYVSPQLIPAGILQRHDAAVKRNLFEIYKSEVLEKTSLWQPIYRTKRRLQDEVELFTKKRKLHAPSTSISCLLSL